MMGASSQYPQIQLGIQVTSSIKMISFASREVFVGIFPELNLTGFLVSRFYKRLMGIICRLKQRLFRQKEYLKSKNESEVISLS